MSGVGISRALHDRFETIRRSEIDRLRKKLRGLTDEERRLVEAVTADVVYAIARVPAAALVDEAPQPAIDAVFRLFGL